MKNLNFILIAVLIAFQSVLAQSVIFKSFSDENGLSGSDVNCVMQDRKGFIWIGTENGLDRFDGNDFKVFRQQHNSESTLSDNSVWSLCEDDKGNIWIGTKQGVLNKYDPTTEKFSHIKLGSFNSVEASITCITQDRDRNLWIGTYSQGLFLLDAITGKTEEWKYNPNYKNGIRNTYITSILQDADGFIWISTYNGLNRFDPQNPDKGVIKNYSSTENPNTINDNLVWRVNQSQTDKNILWICTAKGLCSYNIKTGIFTRLNVIAETPSQFSNSFAYAVEQNVFGQNILWAATYGGLFKIDLNTKKSEQFISDKNSSNGLLSNQISQLLLDRSGVLWIVTDKGLNNYSMHAQKFNKMLMQKETDKYFDAFLNSDVKSIAANDDNSCYLATSEGLFKLSVADRKSSLNKYNELNSFNLWSLVKGNDDNLWIGTYGYGLINYNLKTLQTKIIKLTSPTFQSSALNYIKSLHQSKNGKLWIGFWGSGLAAFDPKTEEYKIWVNDINNEKSLSFNDVWALYEDKLGRLWVGTNGGGLNLFIPKGDGEFKSFKYQKNNRNSILSNSILTITELHSDNIHETILLVGTQNGLSKIVIKNLSSDIYDLQLKYINYSDSKELLDRSIRGILEDDEKNLWISTSYGILKIYPENASVISFNKSDGLNSNIFNPDAACRLNSGIMVVGSVKGPAIFNPNEINLSNFKPRIVLTDFQLFNQSVIPGNDSPLKSNIDDLKEIKLSYEQNVFSFRFSSLDYNTPEQIKFMYKMEGFDRDWIVSGNRHIATYTHLDDGIYYFKVRGTNSDGQWSNNEKSIKLIITAPWWRTVWAYVFYVSMILLGLIMIRKFELTRTKLRNELRVRELESKKSREIENMKSRFFANLSHEFRTPLLLIKGPIEQLLEGKAINKEENYELIHKNSIKLQTLIDQLLELSQLESASIPLNAKYENIIPVLRGLFYSFASLAEAKKINLKFTASGERLFLWIDKDKLEKIINNILSNAFKFTPDGGSISIDLKRILSKNKAYAEILISDTGIGIPQNKIDKIFDRFYQVDDSSRRSFGGSGIGLALVRELVDLHKWQVKVESEVGKGTQFILEIPLDDSVLSENEKVRSGIQFSIDNEAESGTSNLTDADLSKQDITSIQSDLEIPLQKSKAKSSILIVEDSEDVRNYINGLLKNDYQIVLAENGEKGLSTALEYLPDLIISDIMMPEMDGLEFCRRIKSDWKTSHIPVILLTAKASGESKIEGLETGADDYITKPFSYRELSIRIKNLLEQRKRLREKFGKDGILKLENISPNKADQEFLQTAISIVDKNISDPLFDSEELAEQIFLSRSQLHRKLQNISGQSTGEFIRTIRLKKAARLILENQFSITQIAFEVGFNSPSHFTKAFKQMFGYLPSEFLDRSNT
jgi:signal transduction histidine kinase/ligand-binding sensor domain-containing protein/DNA-binding response OmpR family regulator